MKGNILKNSLQLDVSLWNIFHKPAAGILGSGLSIWTLELFPHGPYPSPTLRVKGWNVSLNTDHAIFLICSKERLGGRTGFRLDAKQGAVQARAGQGISWRQGKGVFGLGKWLGSGWKKGTAK